MILILDDTFQYRHKFNDVSYLHDERYKKVCLLLEKATKKNFRNITAEKEKYELLCYHRSLKLFNDKGESFISDTTKENFYKNFENKIEFGRDITTNFSTKKIDKSLFYNNLKNFLDYYIDNNKIEIKILFYGEKFEEIERMTLADKIIDIILNENIYNNKKLVDLLNAFYRRNDSEKIINTWKTNKLSIKDIIYLINKKV